MKKSMISIEGNETSFLCYLFFIITPFAGFYATAFSTLFKIFPIIGILLIIPLLIYIHFGMWILISIYKVFVSKTNTIVYVLALLFSFYVIFFTPFTYSEFLYDAVFKFRFIKPQIPGYAISVIANVFNDLTRCLTLFMIFISTAIFFFIFNYLSILLQNKKKQEAKVRIVSK
jgi:hypothetical protein